MQLNYVGIFRLSQEWNKTLYCTHFTEHLSTTISLGELRGLQKYLSKNHLAFFDYSSFFLIKPSISERIEHNLHFGTRYTSWWQTMVLFVQTWYQTTVKHLKISMGCTILNWVHKSSRNFSWVVPFFNETKMTLKKVHCLHGGKVVFFSVQEAVSCLPFKRKKRS